MKASNSRYRAQAVLIDVGTLGHMIGTHKEKHEEKCGIPRLSRMPVLSIETDEGSKTYSAPLGPGLPSVSLPEESILILTDRTTQELASMARRNPKTRKYADKIEAGPPTTTKSGAGGRRILSLAATLGDLHELDQRIVKLLTQERDRCQFSAQCDYGNEMSGSDVMDVYITGAGFGATCSGSALLIASRSRFHARLLGLKVRIHLILISPSVARTHDPINAWANFGVTCKAAFKSMEDASRIVFHTFSGATISHEAHSRLLDTFICWGSSTGNLVASDREEVASSVGLLLFFLAHSPLAAFSEAAFCDATKMIVDRDLGYRGMRRIGLVRFSIDRQQSNKVAINAAVRKISDMVNPPSN
jgi:hypothetical protein